VKTGYPPGGVHQFERRGFGVSDTGAAIFLPAIISAGIRGATIHDRLS
jgi:hypothetical protein